MKPTAPSAGEVKAISSDDVVGVLPASGERIDERKIQYPRNETTSQEGLHQKSPWYHYRDRFVFTDYYTFTASDYFFV